MSYHRTPIFWGGLDVHRDSVTAAVFRGRDPEPLRVDRLPYDLKKIRRWFEYLALLDYKLQRRDELDGRIEQLALTPRFKPVVDRICGFKTQAAMVLATELGDMRRLESPRQLMAYLGLVPGEHSSGERRRMGAITKAGNTRVRHILIQAAWHYRRRPTVGAALRRRQRSQDPAVIAHAWKCQHRLHKLFHRLAERRPSRVAATAVAREMVGFLWAVLLDVDVTRLQEEAREAA